VNKTATGGMGTLARTRWATWRGLRTLAFCAAGVAMPLGCIMPTPAPEPDSGVEEDAQSPDAAGRDARVGDALADQSAIDDAAGRSGDAAGDATGAPDALEDVVAPDVATEDAAAPDGAAEDAVAPDAAAPDAATSDAAAEDAATPDVGTEDVTTTAEAGTEDATVADATADAEGDATVDAGPDDAAPASDASVVITGGGTLFPQATCVTAADSQTLTFSNPGDTLATWTSSVTSSAFGGPPLATLVPASGTISPGQSMTVTLVFALSDPALTQSIQIQIASGGATTTLEYFEGVTGYDVVAAPATVDFGDVFPLIGFDSDAVQTVNIDATWAGFNSPSPCAVFNLAQSSSSPVGLFTVQDCTASPTGGANVTFEFDAPAGAPPGLYQATYTFVASPISGPPCHSPPPIQLTANFLAPPDAGP
jgi:hypothetical protein